MTAVPAQFGPGDSVVFTLTVRAPALAVGGAYVTTGNVGVLRARSGGGLAAQGQGLSHSSPKAAVGGVVSFELDWQAPSEPGAVRFFVAALAANGNGASSGDSPGFRDFDWTFGCEGVTSYVDLDRDGYGAKALGTRLHCANASAPPGFADLDGDCDENDEKAHPGATEVCNKKDDDCDGLVDEGAPPVSMWPDADGDGFYAAQSGAAKVGCGNVPGYAAAGGDCDDLDAAIHPNANETCNARDDDCDGEVDERVRPQCGVGWCSRYSSTCDALDCRPGEPAVETCNAFDDDCDGELDNNDACAAPPCVSGSCGGGGNSATSGSTAQAEPLPSTGGGTAAQPQPSSGCTTSRRAEWPWASWLVLGLAVLRLYGARARR